MRMVTDMALNALAGIGLVCVAVVAVAAIVVAVLAVADFGYHLGWELGAI
jgi:hypothetical protein